MDKNKEIEDSVEFCKDIDEYYKENKSEQYTKAKKEYERINRKRLSEQMSNTAQKNMSVMEKSALFKQPAHKKAKASLFRQVTGILLCILAAVLLANIFQKYIGEETRVNGISMEDTLNDKDVVIIDKTAYKHTEPKRFDIIVFPANGEEYYIKRIIGLPGETVQIADGRIIINGSAIEENYGKEAMNTPGEAASPVALGREEYFVLGDNRNHSMDSRDKEVGLIKRSDIIGRVWFRIYPFHDFGKLKHK